MWRLDRRVRITSRVALPTRMPSRRSGLLLHVTSLPGPYGIGDLGPQAYRFAEFLARAAQTLWQVLPLVPAGDGHSPYASPSTFAGNRLLISPDLLVEEGLITRRRARAARLPDGDRIDWEEVVPRKQALLDSAFESFQSSPGPLARPFSRFCKAQATWLDDYALFMALRRAHDGAPWTEWPAPLARRQPGALRSARKEHADQIERHRFWQFLFDRQWHALRAKCHARGIQIFGDLPIYVALDSADVWAEPDLFFLDESGQPTRQAGVPPDYFSETGQLWGNPIYRWREMRQRGFAWWRRRLARTLEQVDLVRLDHFRGLEAYWSVPAGEETAVNGKWVRGPGGALLKALEEEAGRPLPMVAEDLGEITPAVRRLMRRFQLPGMVVLQFGFDGKPNSEYLPHCYRPNQVAYTGTHDNNTVGGWLEDDASDREREAASRYLHLETTSEPAHRAAVRAVMASVCDTAVFPLQDVLGLGSEARMNVPGVESGNWSWRCREEAFDAPLAAWLRELTETYGRAPQPSATEESM